MAAAPAVSNTALARAELEALAATRWAQASLPRRRESWLLEQTTEAFADAGILYAQIGRYADARASFGQAAW